MGTNAAATLCTNTLRSFSNIRYMYFCGIAGGAPDPSQPKFDVRLGDVVNSNLEGGVVQYGFGKQLPDKFKGKHVQMNPPSRSIKQLVDELERDDAIDEQSLSERVAERASIVDSKVLRSTLKFSRPEASTDRLFKSDFRHPPDEASCSLQSCPDSQVVPRPARPASSPRIHSGSIASGDIVMKDAVRRDAIRQKHGVLCFEMEGAGLVQALTQHMDAVSYFIIRGICDYSDSHKNDQWQGYAAAVAAAFLSLVIERHQKLLPRMGKQEGKEEKQDTPSEQPPPRPTSSASSSHSSSSSSSSSPSLSDRPLTPAERQRGHVRGSLELDYLEPQQRRWRNEHEPSVEFKYSGEDYYAAGEAGERLRSMGRVHGESPGFSQPVFFSPTVLKAVKQMRMSTSLFRRNSDGDYFIYMGDLNQHFTPEQQQKLLKHNIESTGNYVTRQLVRDT
ncbi:hypothetical protein MMC34_008307 [Xylographa carneopallida]|nr:hypothetical protein [Xylographa carneopallida]